MNLAELTNKSVFRRGFEKKRAILGGEYLLIATHGPLPYMPGKKISVSDQFRIEARYGDMPNKAIAGWVNFEIVDDHLEAIDLYVDRDHRFKGIATEMYKFAKDLGNTIKPSPKQTGPGKAFWASGKVEEGLSHPCIVVDVQPEYSGMNDGDENPVFPEIIEFVVKQTGPVLMLVNAEDTQLTRDSVYDIKRYWEDTISDGEDEERWDNPEYQGPIDWSRFKIIDKGYGYLRSWMDQDVPNSIIIKTIRLMYQQKVSDSRDLVFPGNLQQRSPEVSEIMNTVEQMDGDPLIVDWISIRLLKQFNGAYIMGGGRDQCLREVELLMNAFNIKYKRIDQLVY